MRGADETHKLAFVSCKLADYVGWPSNYRKGAQVILKLSLIKSNFQLRNAKKKASLCIYI